jgi:DNA mismatch repair protein MutS2
VEQRARLEVERAPAEPAARGPAAPLVEGAHVRITASGLQGIVIELRDNRATVEVGGLRIQVPASGLSVTDAPAQPQRRLTPSAWSLPDVDASPEVDLRGMRAEDVAAQLNRAVDAAIQTDLPSLRIIHGKGTGALREVVTEILKGDGRIRSFRPGGVGEGGTGVTVAELR